MITEKIIAIGMLLLVGGGMIAGYLPRVGAQGLPAGRLAEAAIEKHPLIVTSHYQLGPEDVLDINVWRNGELSRTVTVRPDGKISFPLIGDLQASGLTPAELTANIVDRLKSYVQTPAVSVIVKEVRSYSFYVMGQIQKPGRYPLNSKTTLLQAITLAGGFTPTADRNRIVVFRLTGDREERKLKANYTDIVMKDDSHQNVVLKPGDTVVVPSETMVITN